MDSGSQLRTLGRFLYTQNPFYLISCFLILYGLQVATLSYGNLYSRSLFLTVSIAAYTLLMAVTSVGVVRLGKVWQDARSIFLVVIIALVALSTGLDELCNSDWSQGAALLSISGGFALLISEFVIRACGLRLPSWYRLSYYAFFTVFFASPIVLGYAVSHRQPGLTNWGAPLFSLMIGGSLLLLAPAMRQGNELVRENGTPWRWPLYPLSAFVILAVLAGIRTHAIWMSFGFLGFGVRFEPFLLLPIVFAILVLWAETDAGAAKPVRAIYAMGCAPIMMLCGSSRQGGMTYLPIQNDLETFFGSGWTIAIGSVVLFYLYAMIRRIPIAVHAFAAALIVLSLLGKMPQIAIAVGLKPWMIVALASVTYLCMCLRKPTSDVRWCAFSVSCVLTILMAGHAYRETLAGVIAAAVFTVVAMMVIGAVFETTLARVLRHTAGMSLVIGAATVAVWHFVRSPGSITIAILVATCVATLFYVCLVKRLGWLYVFGAQTASLACILATDGYHAGAIAGANLPIQSGILCFLIAITITIAKTGVHRRFWPPPSSHGPSMSLARGL